MDQSFQTTTLSDNSPTELLKTIKYSNNFLNMKLPKANYEKLIYATLPSAGGK
jgi:hypothetical protein